MKAQVVARESKTLQVKGSSWKDRLENLSEQLGCTVTGLFYLAGNKYLSHMPTSKRFNLIRRGVAKCLRALAMPKAQYTAPQWVESFFNYITRPKKTSRSRGQLRPRRGRRLRTAFAH